MRARLYGFSLFCLFYTANALAWNDLGHCLVAQIAQNHLNNHAKQIFEQYNQSVDKETQSLSLVDAATWLDNLKRHDVNWFSTIHYMDLYFSDDGSKLPTVASINAVWAINEATRVLLSSKATDFDKGVSLRILLHVVGDIHQPLHGAARVSKQFPQGDQGGNRVKLGKNPVASNLHGYWDKGAGFLISKKDLNQTEIIKKTAFIEHRWPCQTINKNSDSMSWARESYQLAREIVYQIQIGKKPDKEYQQLAQEITQQRIALAGCRLADLLNQIDTTLASR